MLIINHMDNLFNTPEQGQRLKELLPELESGFMWVQMHNREAHTTYWHLFQTRHYMYDKQNLKAYSALTLQELRDVAQREFAGQIVADPVFANAFETWVYTSNAPDLADWVIARLENER